MAAELALAAAAAGRSVQLVGKIGNDEAGDALLTALAFAGVGHAAILRDAANATPVHVAGSELLSAALEGSLLDDQDDGELDSAPLPVGLSMDAADVALALRYLTDFHVVVVAAPLDTPAVEAVLDAAGFAGAHVIHLDGADVPGGAPGDRVLAAASNVVTTAFEAPAGHEPAFIAMVGRYAAGLDAGREPRDAFADAARDTRWERAASE